MALASLESMPIFGVDVCGQVNSVQCVVLKAKPVILSRQDGFYFPLRFQGRETGRLDRSPTQLRILQNITLMCGGVDDS
jgi:hypothetical protein